MKASTAVLALASAVPFASAINLLPRNTNSRTVGLPIERRHVSDILEHDRRRLRKRQNSGYVSQTLDNEQSLYYANLTLGTPAQNLRLHIDTGSSDLWVNTAESAFCSSRQNPCEGGTFDYQRSSTLTRVNNEFNISYVDGSGAAGSYVADTLGFGDVQLQQFQFGIGESSSSEQGVLGIGYALNEVQVNRAGLQPYPNLPVALVDGGYIRSNAYSLWLNDLDASEGMILFGGVNTAKYEGDLATLPIIRAYGYYIELTIALTGVTVDGTASTSSNLPAPLLLDSGSTLMYLPDDIVQQIYNRIQAVYVEEVGAAYASCSLQNQDKTIDFTFSGKTIKVPYNELFLDAGTDRNGNPLTFQNGDVACLFGIAPAGDSSPILGDTFLRSAYVVYDLDNNQISLAQTVFNSTDNNILEIGTGTGAVPNATPVPSPVTTLAAGTGGARLGSGATGTVTVGLGNPTSSASGAAVRTGAETLSEKSLFGLFALVLCAILGL